ncbi:MAG TPA: hypothetical protein VNT52_13815 [Acidimicrobiales bacterium]|nr:hypothetical protein [Acidimicrobiales bacterium]
MSENKQSFWSTIPGLITGIAGLLTGIVGLVTVLIQLDVIGGGDDTPSAGVTTTIAPGGTAGTAGGASGGAISGRLTADPASLRLATGEREKTLTVRNSANAAVTVLKPEYTGTDRSAFSTDAGCTNVVLQAGRSCTLKVTLSPSGPLKTYRANLVLEAKELQQATEVPIEATTLL